MEEASAMPPAIWGWSDRGRQRTANEDRILPLGAWPAPFQAQAEAVSARGYLVAVADGVSSAGLGAAAGETALAALFERFYASAAPNLLEALVDAVSAANAAAWNVTQQATAGAIAATTLVAAAVRDHTAWIAHVGDSRCYLITPGRTELLTSDHSVVQELVDAGEIGYQEALEHPQQGVLTRALGIGDAVAVDFTTPITLGAKDRLLLCSDGLTTLVGEEEIGAVARQKQPRAAVETLIALANHRGGYDNVSAVIVGHTEGIPWWRRWRR